MTGDVLVLADPDSVAEAAAEMFAATAESAVHERGRFTVALAGGRTPQRLYRRLAKREFSERIPWDAGWYAFGDERCVPPDHPDSNYRAAYDSLLSNVPIPPERILRMRGELDQPSRAAFFYEQNLRELFPDDPWPRFDLVLLGMGADGHTASLFPGTDALAERERWVTANWAPALDAWRLTLTLPALCAARQVLFLITGQDKAKVVAQAFCGAPHDAPHPAELVVPTDGAREILLDAEAAALLDDEGQWSGEK